MDRRDAQPARHRSVEFRVFRRQSVREMGVVAPVHGRNSGSPNFVFKKLKSYFSWRSSSDKLNRKERKKSKKKKRRPLLKLLSLNWILSTNSNCLIELNLLFILLGLGVWSPLWFVLRCSGSTNCLRPMIIFNGIFIWNQGREPESPAEPLESSWLSSSLSSPFVCGILLRSFPHS